MSLRAVKKYTKDGRWITYYVSDAIESPRGGYEYGSISIGTARYPVVTAFYTNDRYIKKRRLLQGGAPIPPGEATLKSVANSPGVNLSQKQPLQKMINRLHGEVNGGEKMKLLIKAQRRNALVEKLVWVKHPVTGKMFQKKVWVLPGEVQSEKPTMIQEDLFSSAELQTQEPPIVDTPLTDDKKISDAIANATPDTRSKVQAALFGNDPGSIEDTPFEFTPKEISAPDHLRVLGHETVSDYREVPPAKVHIFNKKKILETERPSWIPDIPIQNFQQKGWWLPVKDMGDGSYVVKWNYPRADSNRYLDSKIIGAARMNLDTLVATYDYYSKLESERSRLEYDRKDAELRKGYADRLAALREKYTPEEIAADRKLARNVESIERMAKDGRYRRSRHSMLSEKKMTREQGALYDSTPWGASREAWQKYHEFRRLLSQKAQDMEIQQEEWESSFGKGRETAYGSRNARDFLLDSHGVMVKRQNGDEISPEEVEDIRTALDQVFSVYGDRSEMARKWGLKISHSGDKLQHARQALGIFFPAYHAIGVTMRDGKPQFGFTLAHEWAHFMDHYLAGGRSHFASDDYGSLAGRIASTFRDNMAKEQKSKYQNRTCECFARAFEQYFATQNGEAMDYQAKNNTTGNHPEQSVFEKNVAPMIDEFFVKHGEMLKSMRVQSFRLGR